MNTFKVTWSPTLNGRPRQKFTVLLNDLAFRVDENKRIVRVLVWVILVLLAGHRKYSPDAGFSACFTK